MNDLNPQRAAIVFTVYNQDKALASNIQDDKAVALLLGDRSISYKEVEYYPQANAQGGRTPVPSFVVDASNEADIQDILRSFEVTSYLALDPYRTVTQKHVGYPELDRQIGVLKLAAQEALEPTDRYIHDPKYSSYYRIAFARSEIL